MTQKSGQVANILKLLDRSYGGLTFAEIANRINDTRPALQKALHYLYKEGRVNRAQDNDGIVHYSITEKGKAKLKGDTSVINLSSFTVEEAIESKMTGEELADFVYKINKPKNSPWATLVEEAEQRGFAQGYAEGVKTSQAQAYQDAKLDIVRRLVGIVS